MKVVSTPCATAAAAATAAIGDCKRGKKRWDSCSGPGSTATDDDCDCDCDGNGDGVVCFSSYG